jgi:hypothetical protein
MNVYLANGGFTVRFLWRTDFSITAICKNKMGRHYSVPLSDMAFKASSVLQVSCSPAELTEKKIKQDDELCKKKLLITLQKRSK